MEHKGIILTKDFVIFLKKRHLAAKVLYGNGVEAKCIKKHINEYGITADIFSTTFSWCKTKEGYDYWSSINYAWSSLVYKIIKQNQNYDWGND